MKPLGIRSKTGDGFLVIELAGELDLATVQQSRDHIQDLVSAASGVVVLDLGGVTFLDSTALTLFVSLHRRLSAAGRLLILANVSRQVGRPIALTGVDRVITVNWADQPVRPWEPSADLQRMLGELAEVEVEPVVLPERDG